MSKFGAWCKIVYEVATDQVAMRLYDMQDNAYGKMHLVDAERLPVLLFQLVDAGYTVSKDPHGVILAISPEKIADMEHSYTITKTERELPHAKDT